MWVFQPRRRSTSHVDALGYAAFENKAPGNFLTGFGFYEPFWHFANICIVIHLVGACQVFAQPFFGFVEKRCNQKFPKNKFITVDHALKIPFCINLFRLVWRALYVIVAAIIAMIFPFFNDLLGLIGVASFYPLTVYSLTWIWLKILTWACLVVSLVAGAGSIQGLAQDVKRYQPFKPTTE